MSAKRRLKCTRFSTINVEHRSITPRRNPFGCPYKAVDNNQKKKKFFRIFYYRRLEKIDTVIFRSQHNNLLLQQYPQSMQCVQPYMSYRRGHARIRRNRRKYTRVVDANRFLFYSPLCDQFAVRHNNIVFFDGLFLFRFVFDATIVGRRKRRENVIAERAVPTTCCRHDV